MNTVFYAQRKHKMKKATLEVCSILNNKEHLKHRVTKGLKRIKVHISTGLAVIQEEIHCSVP